MVSPPAVLDEYHALQIDLLDTIYGAMTNLPADDPFNPFSLLAAAGSFIGRIEAAEGQLTPAARSALTAAGCIEE